MSRMKSVTGFGWAGVWNNGELGFLVSEFVAPGKFREPLNADQKEALGIGPSKRGVARSDMYRVKITLSLVKGKRGRPIVRRAQYVRL